MTNYSNWSKPRRGLILLMALIFALLSMSQVNAKPEKNPDEPFAISIAGPSSSIAGTVETYTLTYDSVASTGGVKYTPPTGFTITDLSLTNSGTEGSTRVWDFGTSEATGIITIQGTYNNDPCTPGSTTHAAQVYDTHSSGTTVNATPVTTTVVCPVDPTVTSTVEPTIEATTTVTPTATVEATVTVTPTATVEATVTVTPTATIAPTVTPVPVPGTINGTVFNDLNANGVQDPGEAGIAGVTVTLDDDETATTDADGNYTFTNVAVGSHVVSETDPADYASTTPNEVPVNMTSGDNLTVDFGDILQGTVSGSVLDNDGSGIDGLTVTLRDSNGDVVATATTDANGAYSFPNINQGTYTVQASDPDGFVGISSNPKTVTIGTDGSATATFIYQRIGTISGTVFNDRNRNGLQNGRDFGLAGITVTLSNGSSTTTDANGYYQFNNVPASNTPYQVEVSTPNDHRETSANPVSVPVTAASQSSTADFGLARRPAPGFGFVAGVICFDFDRDGRCDGIEGGLRVRIFLIFIFGRSPDGGGNREILTDADGSYVFEDVAVGSYRLQAELTGDNVATTPLDVPVSVPDQGTASVDFAVVDSSSVGGIVFADTDGNGTQGETETGLSGVEVSLMSGGSVVEITYTNVNGGYEFDNIDSDTSYNVVITPPTGLAATDGTDKAVTATTPANFGLGSAGTLSGVVYRDQNGNGMQDETEVGLNGAEIELSNGETAVTNGDGVYEFTGLTAGDYTVTETDPPGFVSMQNSNSLTVTLSINDSASANFPDRLARRVGGVAFNDLNGNGTQDAGEAGFGSATIELRDADGNVVASATTLANGAYEFLEVADGEYTVVVTVPNGFEASTPTEVSAMVSDTASPVANFGLAEQGPTAVSQSSLNSLTPTTEPFWLALLLLGTVAGLAFYRTRFVK